MVITTLMQQNIQNSIDVDILAEVDRRREAEFAHITMASSATVA